MGFPFVKGDRVRHHIFGRGVILSLGHRCATVRFVVGIETSITTDNLELEPF